MQPEVQRNTLSLQRCTGTAGVSCVVCNSADGSSVVTAGVFSREIERAGTSSIESADLFSMVENWKGASSRVKGAECLGADVYDFKGSNNKSAFCIVCSAKIKIMKFLSLYEFACAQRYNEVKNEGTISDGALNAGVSCM